MVTRYWRSMLACVCFLSVFPSVCLFVCRFIVILSVLPDTQRYMSYTQQTWLSGGRTWWSNVYTGIMFKSERNVCGIVYSDVLQLSRPGRKQIRGIVTRWWLVFNGYPSLCFGCLYSWYGKLVHRREMNAVKSAVQGIKFIIPVMTPRPGDVSETWLNDARAWWASVHCGVHIGLHVVTLEGLQTFAAVTPWSHGNWAWAHIVCSTKSMPLLKRHYIIVLKLSNEAVFLHFQSDIKDN